VTDTKIKELRAFAKEYKNYAKKMPTDPYATRWMMISEALAFQADALEASKEEEQT
jgi:hypothetical protein